MLMMMGEFLESVPYCLPVSQVTISPSFHQYLKPTNMCCRLALSCELYNVILFMCELLGLEMVDCWEFVVVVRLGLAYLFFFFFSFLFSDVNQIGAVRGVGRFGYGRRERKVG